MVHKKKFTETDIINTTTDNNLCHNDLENLTTDSCSENFSSSCSTIHSSSILSNTSDYSSSSENDCASIIDDLKSFKSNNYHDKTYKKSIIKNLSFFYNKFYYVTIYIYDLLSKLFLNINNKIKNSNSHKKSYLTSSTKCTSHSKYSKKKSSKNNCCNNSCSSSSSSSSCNKKIFVKHNKNSKKCKPKKNSKKYKHEKYECNNKINLNDEIDNLTGKKKDIKFIKNNFDKNIFIKKNSKKCKPKKKSKKCNFRNNNSPDISCNTDILNEIYDVLKD